MKVSKSVKYAFAFVLGVLLTVAAEALYVGCKAHDLKTDDVAVVLGDTIAVADTTLLDSTACCAVVDTTVVDTTEVK